MDIWKKSDDTQVKYKKKFESKYSSKKFCSYEKSSQCSERNVTPATTHTPPLTSCHFWTYSPLPLMPLVTESGSFACFYGFV